MIFVDTSVFVDVLRSNGPKGSIQLFKQIEEENLEAYTSVITVAELSVGAYRSPRKDSLEKTFNLLSLANVVDMDRDIAQRGGKIYSDLMDQGKEIELNDCLISATTISLNINDVITRDIDHFKRIDDIKPILPEDWLKKDEN